MFPDNVMKEEDFRKILKKNAREFDTCKIQFLMQKVL